MKWHYQSIVNRNNQVKRLKQIGLIFASLYILASAVASPLVSINKSNSHNSQDQTFSIFIDDDIDAAHDIDLSIDFHSWQFIQYTISFYKYEKISFYNAVDFYTSSIPFYLKVQNLRI